MSGGARADTGWRFMVRALRHRNYRLYFVGQGVSLVGTWITRVATSWLVYRLTGSAFLLGLVAFAGQIPTFLLAPFGGVLVDRWDRRRILIVTQTLGMLQSFALAALALSGSVAVWQVAALCLLQGLINAFDTPARQAFVVDMLDRREDLPNAIVLSSSMINAARLLGPSVAGVLIALVGEGGCFLIDGVSYLAVLGSLFAMRITPRPIERPRTHVREELSNGFRYAFHSPPIRSLLGLVALVSLMGMPHTVLMPVIATRSLHGGSHTLGFLVAASGVGALVGAAYLATRRSVLGLSRTIVLAAGTFGLGLVGVAASHTLWLSLVLMLVTGFGLVVELAASNTILQTIVEEHLRGRLMSLYTMAFIGTAPLGSLMAGALATRIGATWTIALGGFACVAGALWFAARLPAFRERMQPIYARLGLLPERVPAEPKLAEAKLERVEA